VVNTCCTGTAADLAEALGYSSSALRLRRYLAIQAQSAVGAFVPLLSHSVASPATVCRKDQRKQRRPGTIC